MNLPIYMDHAATTPLCDEARTAMAPYLSEQFANPSALYGPGQLAREAVERARSNIGRFLGADADEIFFTSGGTESNNWAVRGLAFCDERTPKRLITTRIEHHSVLMPALWLRSIGWDVEWLEADSYGVVEPSDLAKLLAAPTALVAVMHANNEMGSVQPIAEIASVCAGFGVPLHMDAVQTVGSLPLNLHKLGVSSAAVSAHKFYGPKGVGVQYIRSGEAKNPYMLGGEQEQGFRAGTLNVPAVVGMAAAVEAQFRAETAEPARIAGLRDQLVRNVLSTVEGSSLAGHPTQRLPNNAEFLFKGIEGETLVLDLDMAGVCASSGSACTAGSTEPSHVLLAMGVSERDARGALRLTLGRDTTAEAVDYAAGCIAEAVANMRGTRLDSGLALAAK